LPRLQAGPTVIGVSGAQHQSFASEEDAYRVFEEARLSGETLCLGGRPPDGSGASGGRGSVQPITRSTSAAVVSGSTRYATPARTHSERTVASPTVTRPVSSLPQVSPHRSSQSPHGLFSPYSTSSSPLTGVTQVVGSQHSDSDSGSNAYSSSRSSSQGSAPSSPSGFQAASFRTPSMAASYPSVPLFFDSTGHYDQGETLSPLNSPRLSSSPRRRRPTSSSSRRTTSPRTAPLPASPGSGHHHEVRVQPMLVMVPVQSGQGQGGCSRCEETTCQRCHSPLSDMRYASSHSISLVHTPAVVYEPGRDPRSPFILGTSIPIR
jgi:hypothetical protein